MIEKKKFYSTRSQFFTWIVLIRGVARENCFDLLLYFVVSKLKDHCCQKKKKKTRKITTVGFTKGVWSFWQLQFVGVLYQWLRIVFHLVWHSSNCIATSVTPESSSQPERTFILVKFIGTEVNEPTFLLPLCPPRLLPLRRKLSYWCICRSRRLGRLLSSVHLRCMSAISNYELFI